MITSEERADFIRQTRRLLMSNLRTVWPSTLQGEQLYRVAVDLFPEYERLHCFKDLTYLEGKEYVERKNPRSGKVDPRVHWREARWCLTIRGTEIADHLLEDKALEV